MRISLVLVLLAACSSTPDAPAAPSLAGAWRSACTDPGNGQGFTLAFDLTDDRWTLDYDAFGDGACANKNLTVRLAGPYAVGAESAAVPGAREARFDFAERTVIAHHEGAAAFLGQACGGTFTPGVPRALPEGCAALGAYPIATCPTDHDIVLLDGDTLRFGARPADNDLCSPAKRPTALGPVLTRG